MKSNLKECPTCNGLGCNIESDNNVFCADCDGIGYTNFKPYGKCDAEPGSSMKVAFMAARYAAGRPLFNPKDNVEPRTIGDQSRDLRQHSLVIDGVKL